MERLYIELENIIKDNLSKRNEQLLSLGQFDNFFQQNDFFLNLFYNINKF